MVNANGYHNTRTDRGWRLTHHIIAEEKLGRNLLSNERVVFKDKDRKNLKPSNIEVVEKGVASFSRRKAQLKARIEELQAQLRELEEEERAFTKQD